MTSPHRLTLDPLTDTTWRLRDRSTADGDPDGVVVACIELRPDGRYAVTWVAHGIASATFATLGELLDSASAVLHPRPRHPASKPIPIAHRPPPLGSA
ncbi:hypothetical protein [Microbacterium sp. T2.11-28]|uniref:hypothetical protein n=1 Tax=unclassified Microbacterium TaxID=2609290 RepID=UPI0024776675|nr:hypothetical protein [Microbacterium sp. T2.11-28]CAI9394215.1 hypothetical protein MICABA_02712 [Microbacterium sp. T2.11-28]